MFTAFLSKLVAIVTAPFSDNKPNSAHVRMGRPYRLLTFLLVAWGAVVFATGSQPAEAEPSYTPAWGKPGSPEAFSILSTYARCVVHTERGLTAKFLASNYPSKDGTRKAYELVGGAGLCIDRYFKADFQFMRGALIEALYAEDVIKRSGKPLVTLGSSAADKDGPVPPTELAKCVVRRRPDISAEVLRTTIASTQQAQAIAALEPDLDQCARETSSPPTFPEFLRFQIAEELYRLASKQQIAGAPPK